MKAKLIVSLLSGVFIVSQAFGQTCRAPEPAMCKRDCWNARAPQCTISLMGSLNRAVIHHTAAASDYNTSSQAESAANVRGVQNYHMDVNGWCDIGYQFLADKLGNLFQGRKYSISDYCRGAHDGCNDNSYGFTALGYYHSPYNNTPTTALLNGLEKLIAWRMPGGWGPTGSGTTYCNGVTDKVIGHRQVSATACPGDKLQNATVEGSGFENDIAARRACP